MSADVDAEKFVRALFTTIDRMDTDGFVGFLTDDAILRFGSAPPVQGADNVRAAVGGFFAAIGGLSHELNYIQAADSRLLCEGEVTYERHNGSTVSLPFANVMELAEGTPRRIRHYKVYADYGPLWAEGD
jgi:ketosteroid isomerase-like protein